MTIVYATLIFVALVLCLGSWALIHFATLDDEEDEHALMHLNHQHTGDDE